MRIAHREQVAKLLEEETGRAIYTVGSKKDDKVGFGVYSEALGMEISRPLPGYCTVFQAEIMAISACCKELLFRRTEGQRVVILVDSQVALRALEYSKVGSRAVAECLDYLNDLSRVKDVVFMRVPGHSGISGNEMADELAKGGAGCLFENENVVGVHRCMIKGITVPVAQWAT